MGHSLAFGWGQNEYLGAIPGEVLVMTLFHQKVELKNNRANPFYSDSFE
jgi:hypothetical protein